RAVGSPELDAADPQQKPFLHEPASGSGFQSVWRGRVRSHAPVEFDHPVTFANVECWLRRCRRTPLDRSVAQVEGRSVASPDDAGAVDVTSSAERAAAMRAPVVDREGVVAIAQQGYGGVRDHHADDLTGSQLRPFDGRRPLLGPRIVYRLIGSDA